MAAHSLRNEILSQRRFRQFATLLLAVAFIIGIAIVPLEYKHGNINTIGEGLWWAVVTASGVGYGDLTPVTPLGRILGVLLIATGVSLTGMIIGLIAHAMHKHQDDVYRTREFMYLDSLVQRLETLEKKIDYMVKNDLNKPHSDH